MLPTIQNPSLTAFKPRSVMLSNKVMNNLSNKPSKTLNPCQKKTLLHSSILHYLQRSGFSKTLKYFQREAQIENDNGNGCSPDLEEMYYKSLETRDDASTNWNNCKEQDLQNSDKKDGEDNRVAVVEAVNKKKKKRSDESNIKAVVNESGTANKFCNAKNSEETLTKDIVPPLKVKSKEKKRKKISDPLDQRTEQVSSEISKGPVDETVCELQLDESSKKGKDKKKKKSKMVSQPLVDNAEPHQLDTQPGENEENPKDSADAEGRGTTDSEANIKSKDKKKKKLDKKKSKRTDLKASNSQTFEEDALDEDDKVSKKRKRLAYEENNSQPVDKVVVEESKRQKTEGSKESDGIKQLKEVKESLGSDPVKGEKGKVALNKSQETPIKQLDVQANGNLDKNGENSTVRKQVKNQQNSTEPKTVNAFQRVKIDAVEYADERLQDNSYWAKDGADIGYGAKAQEVLGQVRGKDFRHEKTKKKRGSYRGGQIDLQTHSIKFNYSDDE